MAEQDLLGDSIAALFADRATPTAVRRAQQEGLDRALWRQVAELGFDQALVPERLGGSGLGWSEVRTVLEACGRYAAPIPLGETIVARGVAGAAGVALPPGVVTGALAYVADDHVQVSAVPFGATADWVLAVAPNGEAYVLAASHARCSPHPGLQAACECDMTWHRAGAHAVVQLPVEADWLVAGAALRTAQIAGALEALLGMTTRYAQERSQFGRPLAKFQAIQQQVAVLAEDVFAARMASSYALSLPAVPIAALVAPAKAVASEAAARACAIAHAVHGAMGISEEYDLQLFTRRLLAWRVQYGSEAHWAAHVGQALLQDGCVCWDFVRAP